MRSSSLSSSLPPTLLSPSDPPLDPSALVKKFFELALGLAFFPETSPSSCDSESEASSEEEEETVGEELARLTPSWDSEDSEE